MPRPMGEKERIVERRRWVMIRRRKGESLDEIHEEWNAHCTRLREQDPNAPDLSCGRSTIATDIKESLRKSVEETNLATTEWRQLHIERIERVLSSKKFQTKLDDGDLFTIDRFDKLIDKLIKLTGAYMPTKIAATDPSGEKEAGGLTDDERAQRIESLLARAAERKRLADTEVESED